MPKRLAFKDCKTVYYALKIAESNTGTLYSEVYETKAQVFDLGGINTQEQYGKSFNYTTSVLLEATKENKFIDEYSKLWITKKPLSKDDEAEYEIVQRGREADGLFSIFCNKIEENMQKIWFSIESNIYSTEMLFDSEAMLARMPETRYFPVDKAEKYWYREPGDLETTTARMTLNFYAIDKGYLKLYLVDDSNED